MASSANLARSLRTVAAKLNGRPGSVIAFRTGIVHSVTAGAAADGNAALVVTVDGNDVPAPYDSHYSATVGDLVLVVLVDGSPAVLAHLIGLPVV